MVHGDSGAGAALRLRRVGAGPGSGVCPLAYAIGGFRRLAAPAAPGRVSRWADRLLDGAAERSAHGPGAAHGRPAAAGSDLPRWPAGASAAAAAGGPPQSGGARRGRYAVHDPPGGPDSAAPPPYGTAGPVGGNARFGAAPRGLGGSVRLLSQHPWCCAPTCPGSPLSANWWGESGKRP